jgi:ribosomal protein uL24
MVQRSVSSKPRKQRARYFQAPKHIIHRSLTVRNRDAKFPNVPRVTVRKGDRVFIFRGQGEKGGYVDKDTKVRKVEAKVARVDYKRRLVFLEDLKIRKRGNKVADRPVEPHNLWIITLDTTDPRRKAELEELNRRAEG